MNSALSSLADLASLHPRGRQALLRGAFEVECVTAAPMQMNERAWAQAHSVMRAPRVAVEQQALVVTRDVAQGFEAVLNSLRANRNAAAPLEQAPRTATPPPAAEERCRWCDRSAPGCAQRDDLAVDVFGAIHTANGRVRAGANWARQAPVSGIVFGDASMHDLLGLTRADFRALFEAAELYVAAARTALPHIQFYEVFLNGGPRSAASVQHAHAQVVGRGGRHFAYPEAIAARAGAGYWPRVQAVHRDLGLAVEYEGGVAWANLVPVKERDITAFSATLTGGADMMHTILQALKSRGTNSYSLTAILAPGAVANAPVPERFSTWQPVVWRLIDRGDARARHADIGCLELFGSSVVSTDPFDLARWLRQPLEASDARHLP